MTQPTSDKTDSHLDYLRLQLSNERMRLAAATKPAEIAQRKVWVAQLEREVAGELEFLGKSAELPNLSDDELLAELVETLEECREYFDNRADADCQGDPARYVPNEAMQMLGMIDAALAIARSAK